MAQQNIKRTFVISIVIGYTKVREIVKHSGVLMLFVKGSPPGMCFAPIFNKRRIAQRKKWGS